MQASRSMCNAYIYAKLTPLCLFVASNLDMHDTTTIFFVKIVTPSDL
jgi:hypothetical protein